MTNVHVHVQLKGTTCSKNLDGSVSISVKRTTLNYLAMAFGSIFVCHHVPSSQLLVSRVDDVLRNYDHSGSTWVGQTTVTARFFDVFDRNYQKTLKEYVVTNARSARDFRFDIIVQPPETIHSRLVQKEMDLPVPADRLHASQMLSELYNEGRDVLISLSFDKFRTVLGAKDPDLLPAYMAEINLGINEEQCTPQRIEEGIEAISALLSKHLFSKRSLLYSLGNAWLALREYEKARDEYNAAMLAEDQFSSDMIEAQCCKNLGTVMEKLNNRDAAYGLYSRALDLAPNLPEAHYAMALWLIRGDVNLDRALMHLDSIVWTAESAGRLASVLGWRMEVFFKQGRVEEAFRDLNSLLTGADSSDWIRPWCARMVVTYGLLNRASAYLALAFWNRYLVQRPSDTFAKVERLRCVWHLHMTGCTNETDYEEFKNTVTDLVSSDVTDAAFLWDRAGHWAQKDGNWEEAEGCYRKAFDLSSVEYGYCLGTALNHLGRYEAALPMLLEQAKKHQPDEMSWFQVAIAREGIGDSEGCIAAYKRALRSDENYDLAWFNLGGVYWSAGKEVDAVSTWKEAIKRFPSHHLSVKLLRDFAILRD